MVAYGLAIALGGLLLPGLWAVGIVLVGAAFLAVWSMVYSWWLYRRLGHVDDMTPGPTQRT
jgi:hypothetical protein